jgi:hypothetical protein
MPIDAQIRGQVIKEWLSGDSRDEIAANNKIGAGTVSNILSDGMRVPYPFVTLAMIMAILFSQHKLIEWLENHFVRMKSNENQKRLYRIPSSDRKLNGPA